MCKSQQCNLLPSTKLTKLGVILHVRSYWLGIYLYWVLFERAKKVWVKLLPFPSNALAKFWGLKVHGKWFHKWDLIYSMCKYRYFILCILTTSQAWTLKSDFCEIIFHLQPIMTVMRWRINMCSLDTICSILFMMFYFHEFHKNCMIRENSIRELQYLWWNAVGTKKEVCKILKELATNLWK